MKKSSILFSMFSVLFSCISLAKTSSKQFNFMGENYNFHHYQITLIDDLALKKDNQLILTQPTLTVNIKNFTVNNIRKTENGF